MITVSLKKNTVIFEDKYNVSIDAFSTTGEINKFIEEKEGIVLEVVTSDEDIIGCRGDILPLLDMDIDAAMDISLKKPFKK